jgi:HEAT repeat protein
MAVESLIRYHRAKDERATVAMTERLGRTGSPLTVDELLLALGDPRFNVRFEAIVSIARRGPDPRLTQALVQVLRGNEPALSVIAAWALGRIGDEAALGALREGLDARYRSVQAHCARSLGTLGDREIIPSLLERLTTEQDHGLRMAFAAALGQMREAKAVDQLLAFLRTSQDKASRMELALALARIVGHEFHFIQLLRAARSEPGTAAAQAITAVKKRIVDFESVGGELTTPLDDCAEAFARGELARGTALLSRLIRMLPAHGYRETCGVVLRDYAERLDEFGMARIEYLLLALHTLRVAERSDVELVSTKV